MTLPQQAWGQEPQLPEIRHDSAGVLTADTIRVTAPTIDIEEIIRRATSGERTKLAGHKDMTYTMTIRNIARKKSKKSITYTVFRVYNDVDGNSRNIRLDSEVRHFKREDAGWVLDEDEDEEKSRVQVSSRGDAFSAIPFFLEDTKEFMFTLVSRTLDIDHVIFEIAFEPKSEFKALPAGTVFVDTQRYQIVHEVFHFNENPFPLFLKGINRLSRHWNELPGGEWVWTKLIADVDTRPDPFGFMPYNLSVAVMRDDFRFDQGYDPRLFGEADSDIVPTAAAGSLTSGGEVRSNAMLEQLQGEDLSYFNEELLEVNTVFRDAVVSELDSIGLKDFMEAANRRASRFNTSFGFATHLTRYNRIERLSAGASVSIEPRGEGGVKLSTELAYAFGSERFPYWAELDIPVGRRRWNTRLRGDYSERVVPYGSNRPTLNSVRTFVGGADEQDYLRRDGGTIGLFYEPESGWDVSIAYERSTESSVPAQNTFSLTGDINEPNVPIEDGNDHAVDLHLGYGSPLSGRLNASVRQRLSGGALGGSFDYARTDLSLEYRRYVIGRNELYTKFAVVTTGGTPPIQRVADIGGLSTVRGYDRRTRLGETSFAGRLEYLLGYNLLARTRIPLLRSTKLQFVPWFDAGRVWDGDHNTWAYSIGLGIQRYIGPFGNASNIRLDLAWPLGTNRPVTFRAYIGFTQAFF